MAATRWPNAMAPPGRVGANIPKTKQVIFEPTFAKMEKENSVLTQQLKDAFYKIEKRYPGFSQDFMVGLLYRMGVDDEFDLAETCLRISALQECEGSKIPRNSRVTGVEVTIQALKTLLSSIPDDITDRRAFIEAIKDIANAIKNLLAAVSIFYDSLPSGPQKKCLEEQKRKFITYCRKFSDTLKHYFKNNDQSVVFSSAHLLVNQTNLILCVVREAE